MLTKNIENKMNRSVNKLNKHTSLVAKLFLAAALMAATSVSAAEDDNVAYVDSVLKWGAWELDIEPAAGGISAPTPRALNARGAKVALRTNSIAALAPSTPPSGSKPVNPIIPGTPVPTPVIPTLPVKPFVPTAPTISAPPGATPPIVVTLPSSSPPAPTSPAPSGAITATVVTLP